MNKIVVQYTSDDERIETLCFYATSCEEWVRGFAKELHKTLVEHNKNKDKHNKWWSQKPTSNFVVNDDLEDWLASRPKDLSDGTFTYCGHTFDIMDFLNPELRGKYVIPTANDYIMPTVKLLDEWFDDSCLNDPL